MEKVRCMLKLAKLPKSFWGETVNNAVYLINISPSVPLDFDILQRVWTEKDVSYSLEGVWMQSIHACTKGAKIEAW